MTNNRNQTQDHFFRLNAIVAVGSIDGRVYVLTCDSLAHFCEDWARRRSLSDQTLLVHRAEVAWRVVDPVVTSSLKCLGPPASKI